MILVILFRLLCTVHTYGAAVRLVHLVYSLASNIIIVMGFSGTFSHQCPPKAFTQPKKKNSSEQQYRAARHSSIAEKGGKLKVKTPHATIFFACKCYGIFFEGGRGVGGICPHAKSI